MAAVTLIFCFYPMWICDFYTQSTGSQNAANALRVFAVALFLWYWYGHDAGTQWTGDTRTPTPYQPCRVLVVSGPLALVISGFFNCTIFL